MGERQCRENPIEQRVLVVTADEGLIDYLAFLITASGYTAFIADEEGAALVLAADQRPHLILLDTAMPRRSAVHICERLRCSRGRRDFSISALTDEASNERDKKSDLFDHFLHKPVEPVSLRRLLEDCFGRETRRRVHGVNRERIGPLPVRAEAGIEKGLSPVPTLLRPAMAS